MISACIFCYPCLLYRYTHRAIPCADGFYVVFGGLGNVALHEDVVSTYLLVFQNMQILKKIHWIST